MLNHLDLMDLLERFGLSDSGKEWVVRSRATAPSRIVQSSGNNFITHYQSKKMDRELSFESHTVEYRAGLLNEYSPEVLEYYAQPQVVEFRMEGPVTKKIYRVSHTPDFLVITDHAVYVDEWKPEGRLAKLAKVQPDRFLKDQGVWRSPLLEEYFRPMGINYRLRSSLDLPQLRVANLEFLAGYLDRDCPKVPRPSWERVKSLFEDRTDLLLAELLELQEQSHAGFTVDDLYKMVADGDLMIDLDRDAVHETDRLRVYRDPAALHLVRVKEASANGPIRVCLSASLVAGARIGFDNRVLEVLSAGITKVLLKGEERVVEISMDDLERLFQEGQITIAGGVRSTENGGQGSISLEALSPEEMDTICKRMDLVELAVRAPHLINRSQRRTIQRYRKAMREAGESAIAQHLALASKAKKRGNRSQRIPPKTLDLIDVVNKKYYNSKVAPTKKAAYRAFRRLCVENQTELCSYDSFRIRIGPDVCKREGAKRGYQEREIIWYLQASIPIHGVRPFQFVHIDCTPLELVVIDPKTGDVLGTVWLCLAMDAESRRVVGFYLTFERPGARTTLMVLRDIVRRHGRVPETIIVDWGPENVNAQMQRACRVFGVHIRQRPKGQPRAGSVLERLFGTTHTQFIHLLEGNTKVRKHYRMVTKAVRPENFASWTLVALHGALEEYFEELYGKNPHPAHGAAPVEYFNQRFVETGERRHRMLRFDRVFKIETCPEPHDGPTRQVDRHRGIKVNYIWYWADEFKDRSMDGTKVQVRVDPWDPGVVFALIGHTWVDCTSKYRSLLSRMTWVELQYALHEIKHRLGAKESPLTPERVEEWMRALDPKNFDARLAAEQSEMRMVYQNLDMANINPLLAGEGSLGIQAGPALKRHGNDLSQCQEGENAGGSGPEPRDEDADSNPGRLDDDYPLI